MRGRPRYDGATTEMVVALKEKGYTHQQVADALDVSMNLVCSRLREAGKSYQRGRKPLPVSKKERLASVKRIKKQIKKYESVIDEYKDKVDICKKQLEVLGDIQ